MENIRKIRKWLINWPFISSEVMPKDFIRNNRSRNVVNTNFENDNICISIRESDSSFSLFIFQIKIYYLLALYQYLLKTITYISCLFTIELDLFVLSCFLDFNLFNSRSSFQKIFHLINRGVRGSKIFVQKRILISRANI